MSASHNALGSGMPAKLGLVALAALGAGPASAAGRAPDALRAGAWFISPWVASEYSADNNVFRQSEAGEPSTDRITSLSGGVTASLPLPRSEFQLGAELTQIRYQTHTFTRDTDRTFAAEALFKLAKYDELRLSELYSEGFTDVARLENSELVFDGKPYDRNWLEIELARGIPHRPGYSARVTWTALEFLDVEAGGPQAFYDYDGYDVGLEYRQPLPGYKWIVGYAGQRNYEHFESGSARGVPFRDELSRNAQLGLRGLMGKNQPFVLRLGWGEFHYEYDDPEIQPSDFRGLTAFGRLRFAVGGGTSVDVAIERGAKPSAYDTHYVNTLLSADMSRDWRTDSRFGMRVRYDKNTYGDPIDTGSIESGGCGTIVRDDDRYEVEGYVDWMLHRRFGYEMAASFEFRNSNCALYEYRATVLSLGVRAGWF